MEKKIKKFNVRLPYDLWLYLTEQRIKTDAHMNTQIVKLIEKAKKKTDKKLLTAQLKIDTIASLETNTDIEQ